MMSADAAAFFSSAIDDSLRARCFFVSSSALHEKYAEILSERLRVWISSSAMQSNPAACSAARNEFKSGIFSRDYEELRLSISRFSEAAAEAELDEDRDDHQMLPDTAKNIKHVLVLLDQSNLQPPSLAPVSAKICALVWNKSGHSVYIVISQSHIQRMDVDAVSGARIDGVRHQFKDGIKHLVAIAAPVG